MQRHDLLAFIAADPELTRLREAAAARMDDDPGHDLDHCQRVALWSVSAVDWGPLATPERIRARLSALRAGDIVLMHDGPLRHNRPAHTLQVLPPLLAALTREGPIPAPLPVAATMTA